jgi:hypothetical protein
MSTRHKPIHRENEEKSQLRAFRKAARELGADKSDERFKAALRKIAKHKPKPEAQQAKKGSN